MFGVELRCPSFQRVLCTVLGPEDVSLLESPHFRGCYVQASMELGSEACTDFKSTK